MGLEVGIFDEESEFFSALYKRSNTMISYKFLDLFVEMNLLEKAMHARM